MEPGGWCPLAGGNPESSAPLEACRQEAGSLPKNKEQRGELLLRAEVEKDKFKEKVSRCVSPGIWNGLPGSELDGEWGKVALLLPLPGEFG